MLQDKVDSLEQISFKQKEQIRELETQIARIDQCKVAGKVCDTDDFDMQLMQLIQIQMYFCPRISFPFDNILRN